MLAGVFPANETMKARSTHSNNRRRPQWWPAFLSLLVAFLLVAQPACLCAAMQAAPDHHRSHAAVESHAHASVSDAEVSSHGDSHSTGASHHASTRATLSPSSESHICCCDSAPPPLVAAPARVVVPDTISLGLFFTPAILPAPSDIFALTNRHGRDGPSSLRPLSQLGRALLLGRAPPVSV